jgi:hypothetical protein
MDDIFRFRASCSDAHRPPILCRADRQHCDETQTRLEPIIHDIMLPPYTRSLEHPSTVHCSDARRKPRRVQPPISWPDSDDFECRGLLHAGRAGYTYCFAALNLGLQAMAKSVEQDGFCLSYRPALSCWWCMTERFGIML